MILGSSTIIIHLIDLRVSSVAEKACTGFGV